MKKQEETSVKVESLAEEVKLLKRDLELTTLNNSDLQNLVKSSKDQISLFEVSFIFFLSIFFFRKKSEKEMKKSLN